MKVKKYFKRSEQQTDIINRKKRLLIGPGKS